MTPRSAARRRPSPRQASRLHATDENEFVISAGKTIDPKLDCETDLKPLETNAEYLELHPEQIEVLRMLCPNTVIAGSKLQQTLDPLPVLPQLEPLPPPPPPP